jgi:hypothetical protein
MHLSIAVLVEPSRIGVAQQPNAPRVSEEVLSCIRGLYLILVPSFKLSPSLSFMLRRFLLPNTVSVPCFGDNPS